jgi:hypothetical protein
MTAARFFLRSMNKYRLSSFARAHGVLRKNLLSQSVAGGLGNERDVRLELALARCVFGAGLCE